MKFLFVAEDFPWPPTGGGLIRSSSILEVFSDLGTVDLFSLHDAGRTEFEVPDHIQIGRLAHSSHPIVDRRPWARAAWALTRGAPLEVALKDRDRGPCDVFVRWASDRYDLVWFTTPSVYTWLGQPRLGTTIVDLDNLEDVKVHQLQHLRTTESPRLHSVIGRLAATVQGAKNRRDWTALQRSIAEKVDGIALCSERDVERAGLPGAIVIPNGYPRPERPLGRSQVEDPPTILFQGRLNYVPNMDGARWLVEEVGPHLRSKVPHVEMRLVGKSAPSIERLADPGLVSVTGSVRRMDPELARADICVVPLRIGSGTRVKILEAFAHRIPVVSTSVGADGLDVTDGVQLLVADDPQDFASACHRVLVEADLRRRLVEEAEKRYLELYETSVVRARIEQAVDEVSGMGPLRTPPAQST